MPLPTVNEGESRPDFTSRCMGDTEMNKEFPNESQRLAVCNDIYEDKRTAELASDLDKFLEE